MLPDEIRSRASGIHACMRRAARTSSALENYAMAPDATTLRKFRRLLETHGLDEALLAKVGQVLQAQGLKVGTGTIVAATIIGAPSSTKNADKQRDPEVHQTRKGQQRCGMKMHISVDSRSGLVPCAVGMAANNQGKHPLPDLLHGRATCIQRQQRLRQSEGLDGIKGCPRS